MAKDFEKFLSDIYQRNYNSASVELAIEAEEKGVMPCAICKLVVNPDRCGSTSCMPWYVWFRKCWKSIRADAKAMGMKNDKL